MISFSISDLGRALAVALLLAWAAPAHAEEAPVAPVRHEIDFDDYIAKQRPTGAGTRTILKAVPIAFDGRLMAAPKPVKTEYLMTALSMMGTDPLPKVSHQMFLQTDKGLVHPVYVEDAALAEIAKAVPVNGRAHFLGYHVYTYAKGPAIVVSGLAKAGE